MDVKAILKPFLREATDTGETPGRLARLLGAARRHVASSPRNTLSKVGEDLRVLMRLLNAVYHRKYAAVSKKTIVLLVAALVYFVAPVDAIPDALPIVGLVDDCAVLAWVCRAVRIDLDAFVSWEQERDIGVALRPPSN